MPETLDIPLHYRDREADGSDARHRAHRFIANWIAVPTVIVSALGGVLFHFFGTGCLVLAVAFSVSSLPAAVGWMVGAFGFFGVGLGLMLVADGVERRFC